MEQLKRRTFKKRPACARLYGPAAFLALCLAIVFAMSIFFRVSRIEVRGNAYYTADEIVLASGVEEGDRATLTFARDYYQPVSMRVARLSGNEAGSRLLILSSDQALQNVTLLRQQSAEIVFASYSGLRVPKSAVRVENGQTGVYILEGTLAKWKPITILHDTGESYVAALDTSSTDNLWPGDELIINAKNLYDGKVVN